MPCSAMRALEEKGCPSSGQVDIEGADLHVDLDVSNEKSLQKTKIVARRLRQRVGGT